MNCVKKQLNFKMAAQFMSTTQLIQLVNILVLQTFAFKNTLKVGFKISIYMEYFLNYICYSLGWIECGKWVCHKLPDPSPTPSDGTPNWEIGLLIGIGAGVGIFNYVAYKRGCKFFSQTYLMGCIFIYCSISGYQRVLTWYNNQRLFSYANIPAFNEDTEAQNGQDVQGGQDAQGAQRGPNAQDVPNAQSGPDPQGSPDPQDGANVQGSPNAQGGSDAQGHQEPQVHTPQGPQKVTGTLDEVGQEAFEDGAIGGASALMSSSSEDEEFKEIDLKIKAAKVHSISNYNFQDLLPKGKTGPFSIEEAVDGEDLPDHVYLYGVDSTDEELLQKNEFVPKKKKYLTPKESKNIIEEEEE